MRNKTPAKDGVMNIGKVAKLSNVGVETIRFYERAGILPKPKRKPSGYRQFDMSTVTQIQFIQRIQQFGFSLRDAGNIVGGKGIPEVMKRIEQQIAALKDLQRELSKRS